MSAALILWVRRCAVEAVHDKDEEDLPSNPFKQLPACFGQTRPSHSLLTSNTDTSLPATRLLLQHKRAPQCDPGHLVRVVNRPSYLTESQQLVKVRAY
jgi:hypothetical protein